MENKYKEQSLTVAEAARLMGKNPCFIRQGLKTQRFGFGYAVKTGEKNWDFYINKNKFFEETGIVPNEKDEGAA